MIPSTSELLAVAQEEGMTWSIFAARFGVSQSTVRQWCRSCRIEKLGMTTVRRQLGSKG
ncbi:hypothetical protein [Aneurinibacillus aneurinilyticus]|uniref:hypothetical protein n=1 Tax=Aneurinibacillus aneurinilyticus TaxID=1391 RepID=UPI0023F209B1|nr:hypothetical protein [Aneurinibacillus aneurinilyticus]